MRVFTLPHDPCIGQLTLAVGDPWSGHGRSLRVTVPVRGIGQGADGAITLADGYRALASKLREVADQMEAQAVTYEKEATYEKEG